MNFTKRKIVISLLIVACMAAICVGATFAYFVDSMASTGNKIQSGKLDVDFGLLDGKTGQWSSLKNDKTPIFSYQYFERGYTDVKVLKVENKGSLAIKWQARILFRGERSELSDVINVYLLQSEAELSYPTQRSDLDAWDTPITLTYFIDHTSELLAGDLQAGETAYFAIALQMQKDAADKYLDLTLGEFDIQIAAAQLTSESDCFDTDYDIDAEFPCAHSKTVTIVDRDATPDLRGQQRIVCANEKCNELLRTEDVYLIFEERHDYTYRVIGITNDLGSTDIVIPSTYRNKTVKDIDHDAFLNNQEITSIAIAPSITSIGSNAFKGCTSLKKVTFLGDSKLQSIGYYAFQNCSSLMSIAIPDGVSTIQRETFAGCTNLQTVTFGENSALKSIGYRAFYNCSNLKSVIFYENSALESIQSYAFQNCRTLKSIIIPEGVTGIQGYTFDGCTNLTSVTFKNKDNITSIGEFAFQGCTSLGDFEIPSTVKSIGKYAFYCCSSLTNITIPSGIETIREGTFWNCSSIIQSIVIPDSVTSIENFAFANCKSIENITIPTGVTSIGSNAFSGCKKMKSIELPSGITSIQDSTFSACESLQRIEIPNGVTSIGISAFRGCTKLEEIIIPDSVISMGDSMFFGCSSLERVKFPEGITSIGESMFQGCSKLESVEFPSTLQSIGEAAFYDCYNLQSIYIPAGVTSIGQYAFNNCSSLTSAIFENTVGWWYTSDEAATSGTALSAEDLAIPLTAAVFLKSYNRYCYYYWYCTEQTQTE